MKKLLLAAIIVLLLLPVVDAAVVDPTVEDKINKEPAIKILVKLKDISAKPGKFKLQDVKGKQQHLQSKKLMIQSQQEKVLSKLEKKKGFKVGHKYSTINGFSAKVDKAALEELKKDPNVEAIQFDYPVKAMLDVSVPKINATPTWNLQVNGINITGAGETVCVVDTGIDYTHANLGGCSITRVALNGTIENLTTPIESPHPYADSTTYTWTINKTGYTNIAIHFKNMTIESNYDQLKIYDKNWNEIGSYSGNHDDMWSPYGEGDTLYIVWETDANTNGYGIYIDQVINGTSNTTYDWSNCTRVVGGWDFVNSDGNPMDGHSHGTHVAGIIASDHPTYKGVAPDAKLIAIKILSDAGSGTDSDVAAGIDWCINRSAEYNISVISMSLGCDGGGCTHWQTACDDNAEVYFSTAPVNEANNLGIAVVVAAGNSGWTDGVSSPACISGAIPVGATDDNDAVASFSNNGTLLNLLAPGVNIYSTIPGGFGNKDGTSMATPHVAGAAALLQQFVRLQNGSSLTPAQIEDVLNDTGKTIGDYSRIDVMSAIRSLDVIAPVINFTALTPDNGEVFQANASTNISFEINVTVNDTINQIDACLFEINGINQTMNKTGSGTFVYCYLNKSINGSGTITYTVYANDTQNNIGSASREIRINHPTSFSLVGSLSVNETQVVNLTVNATNNDNLTYGINDTRFTQSGNNFTWQTNLTDSGVYDILINVSDGTEVTENNYTITINDAQDFDGDGNPDFNDTDDDNDGINDAVDKLKGNSTTITSSISTNLIVNSSEDINKSFNETYLVNITDENNNSLIEFNFSFNNATLTMNFTINYTAATGEITIRNLDLTQTGFKKTVYINKSSASNNYVCIADDGTTSTSALPSDCTGYTKVACPGTSGQYTCEEVDGKFKVSGLSHSAVKGIYVAPPSGNGGGGGGGGGGSCSSKWSCTEWSECVDYTETRSCYDVKACAAPTTLKPDEVQPCGCVEYWKCEDWKPVECPASGERTRKCLDWNGCGTEERKPEMIESCESDVAEKNAMVGGELTGRSIMDLENKPNDYQWIGKAILITVVALALLLFTIPKFIKRGK